MPPCFIVAARTMFVIARTASQLTDVAVAHAGGFNKVTLTA